MGLLGGWGSLNHRERAILLAVAEGRARMLVGWGCDLAVDGSWCDHIASRALFDRGLIRASGTARVGQFTGAELTTLGRRVIASTTAATATAILTSDVPVEEEASHE